MYTIDVNHSVPSNFINAGYVPTEGAAKYQTNDGLPTYEEAIGSIKNPTVPIAPVLPQPTVDVVNGESQNVSSSRGRRHRHRRNRHQHSERQNENSQPDAMEENRRQRHRRGFRFKKHFAKINRRNHPETD